MISNNDSRISHRNYYIPDMNIQANDQDLKQMKRKILADYYDKQINQKKQASKQQQQQYNPQQNMQNSGYDYKNFNQLYVDYERSIKKQLAQSYKEQIQKKRQAKKVQRQKIVDQQQKRIRQINSIEQKHRIWAQKRSERYQQQMRQMLQKSQKIKKQNEQQRKKQREQYNIRYSPQKIVKNDKVNFFKNYYEKVHQNQESIEKNYIQKWRPEILKRQQKRYGSNSLPNLNSHILQNKLEQHQRKQKKIKDDWKKCLQQQLLYKQQQKNFQRESRVNRFVDQKYENIHHPINNPIDFKIDHHNKYIIRQLTQNSPNAQNLRI